MKIAIPVADHSSRRNEIAGNLNILGFLCIYDTETLEGKWMKTIELAPNMGELLPALEQQTVKTIITKQIHPMALKVLVDKGIQVYKSTGNLLDENIRLLCNNQLNTFDMNSAMTFAKICGGECDSCNTDCDDESTKN